MVFSHDMIVHIKKPIELENHKISLWSKGLNDEINNSLFNGLSRLQIPQAGPL